MRRERDNEGWRLLFLGVLSVLFVLWLACAYTIPSHGEEMHTGHPPQDMALHEQFYSLWNMPDARAGDKRYASCCNNQDCFPTPFRKHDGKWQAMNRERTAWVDVPEAKLEHNYPDAEDSPDGQSHVCMIGSTVFCATLGSGM